VRVPRGAGARLERHRGAGDARGFVGAAYAQAGRPDEARAIATRLALAPNAMNALTLAQIHSGLGEWDEALRWLEYEPHHVWLPWWMMQQAPPELRRRARFQALVHQMHLDSLAAAG
jgi:hypothetical protein